MRFLAGMVDLSEEIELTLNDVLVVRDYVSVFSKDLPRLPPNQEIVFSIELVPRTAPVLLAPYRFVYVELKELKV